jgi:hypothetical protein
MMIDGSAKVFKITADSPFRSDVSRVFPAGLTVDFGKLLPTPELVEAFETAEQLCCGWMIQKSLIIDVDRNHVGDVDVFDVVALPLGLVPRGEVGREAFSASAVWFSEHLVAICLPLSRMTQVAGRSDARPQGSGATPSLNSGSVKNFGNHHSNH